MSSIQDASDRQSAPSRITDAHERQEKPQGVESRATDSWGRLAQSLTGTLPRSLARAEAARQRIARMR